MRDRSSQHVVQIGAFVILALALSACGGPAPEVGRLSVVYAQPAERVEIYSLGAGQTFG